MTGKPLGGALRAGGLLEGGGALDGVPLAGALLDAASGRTLGLLVNGNRMLMTSAMLSVTA